MGRAIGISVIVAVYNMEKYLKQCLDSILVQTLKNIEIICINDGSKDDSQKILDEYAKRDKRIRVLTQENRGFAKTRNRGIDEANGKFVIFMDPDDWYPTKDILKSLYKAANDSGALVCGGCFSEYNERTQSYKTVYGGNLKDYVFEKEGFVEYRDYQFDYGPHRFIYNTEMLREDKIYFPDRARFQDTTFLIHALERAKRFYAIPKIVYCYRIGHQETVWNEKKGTDLVLGIIENLEFAKSKHYSKLYYLTAHRLFVDFYDRVLPCCTPGNKVIREAIENIKSNFDWKLIKEYKANDKFYDRVEDAFYPKKEEEITASVLHEGAPKEENAIVIIKRDGSQRIVDNVPGLIVLFKGKGAKVELAEPLPRFLNCRLEMGNYAYAKFGGSPYRIQNLVVFMTADRSALEIGKNFSCKGATCALCDESNLKIAIGDDCMFSTNIRMRTSDGHAIIDRKTRKVINPGENIVIGNRVWLGASCSILKGVHIPNNCIVGTGAIVTDKAWAPNAIIAGVPARMIKRDIVWTRMNSEMVRQQRNFSMDVKAKEIAATAAEPLVSIVVPIYNVEKYLRECMDSIVRQTLENIEIICVNDGSTDSSLQIVQEYAKSDPRIKIVSHENHGYGYSMNAGFAAATGKYIGIVEPDDYIDIHMYEKLYVAAERFQVEAVKSNFYMFEGDGGNRKVILKELSSKGKELYYWVLTPRNEPKAFNLIKNNWTGIYRRDFIENAGIRHNETPGASYQDSGFWFQVFSKINKIIFIDEAFYYYRQDNPNSSINNKKNAFIVFNEWEFIEKQCEPEIEKYPNVADMFVHSKYNSLYWHYGRINDSFKLEFLEKFRQFLDKAEKDGYLRTPVFSEYELKQIQKLRFGEGTQAGDDAQRDSSAQRSSGVKQKLYAFIKKMPGVRYVYNQLKYLNSNANKTEKELRELKEIIRKQNEIIDTMKNNR